MASCRSLLLDTSLSQLKAHHPQQRIVTIKDTCSVDQALKASPIASTISVFCCVS